MRTKFQILRMKIAAAGVKTLLAGWRNGYYPQNVETIIFKRNFIARAGEMELMFIAHIIIVIVGTATVYHVIIYYLVRSAKHI